MQKTIASSVWITVDEFFNEYGISKQTQATMRYRREIPYYKKGKFIRYKKSEIDEWFENFRVEPIKIV